MLTVMTVRNAKPEEKIYRLFDERGLYLEVAPRVIPTREKKAD